MHNHLFWCATESSESGAVSNEHDCIPSESRHVPGQEWPVNLFTTSSRRVGWMTATLVGGLILTGCASLRPEAAQSPPERGGGFEVSDGVSDVLAWLGPAFYFLGEWLAGTSACQK